MRQSGVCVHGNPYGIDCPHCEAERAARDTSIREAADTDQAKEQAFWDSERTQAAQRALDVWGSVKIALSPEVNGLLPTLANIFEDPVDMLRPFMDHDRGLLITEWCRKHASRTGEVKTKAGDITPLVESMTIYLAVEECLMRTGYYLIYVDVLRRSYPRTGPYQVHLSEAEAHPPQDRSKACAKWEKWGIWAIRDAGLGVRRVAQTIVKDAPPTQQAASPKNKAAKDQGSKRGTE